MRIKTGKIIPTLGTRSEKRVLIVTGKYGTHAVKWPKPRGKAKSGYRLYREQEFRLAAAWATVPDPVELQTAINVAQGTGMVPRDFLTAAAFGTIMTFQEPGGPNWTSYRMVAPNAQLILDQVTDEPGSLLYRADIGWLGLPLASSGMVLTMLNGIPAWQPPNAGSGGLVGWWLYDTPGDYVYAIPGAAAYLDIYMIGGGGGGGSGARRASGTATSGGSGGGGGAILWTRIRTTSLPSTIDLHVGTGGDGGAARVSDNLNGSPGTTGTDTTIVINGRTLTAAHGSAGVGGSTAPAAGGSGGGVGKYTGSAGGSSGLGSAGSSGSVNSSYASTGGGGGAGQSAVPANHNGGAGGAWAPASGLPTTGAAGGIAATDTPPQTGYSLGTDSLAAAGGGGGYNKTGGTASDGATGGNHGAGGGGGASSLNGNLSGAGGAGANGAIYIVAA